jgi:hypothetical protein
MSTQQQPHFDRYIVIHVATTCDEHGVYVTKDSAEVIELGWIELDAQSLEEVCKKKKIHARRATPRASWDFEISFVLLTYRAAVVAPRECPRQAHQHPDHTAL